MTRGYTSNSRGVNVNTRAVGSDIVSDYAVHHWPIDGTGDGVITDVIGEADATLFGPSFVSNSSLEYNTGLEFDGTDDEAQTSTTIGFSDEFTIALTLITTQSNSRFLLVSETGDFSNIRMTVADGKLHNMVGNGTTNKTTTSETTIDTGDPVRVAITFKENNELTAVVNGVTEDSTTVDKIPDPGTDTFFGSDNSGDYYAGIIDNIIFYEKKLSKDELYKDSRLQNG